MKSNTYYDSNKPSVPFVEGNKQHWMSPIYTNLHPLQFLKKQLVLVIAIIVMLITCVFVPVDASYLDYFNWTTLFVVFY